MNELIYRIGTFLNLIAAVLIFLFVASDMAKDPHFDLLFIGLIVLSFGIILRRRHRPQREPSNRFSGIRSLMARSDTQDKSDENE